MLGRETEWSSVTENATAGLEDNIHSSSNV